jgi:hypothetical protein
VLASLGFDTASFGSAKAAVAAFKVRRPQIVFLRPALHRPFRSRAIREIVADHLL